MSFKLDAGTKPSEFISSVINSAEFKTKTLAALGLQDGDITNDAHFMSLYERCQPFTITSMPNMYALYKSS